MIKLPEHYTSIEDMPIAAWLKMQESNDISLMLKTKATLDESWVPELIAAFLKIQDDFIDTYGISESYRKILLLKWEIAKLRSDMVLKKIKSNETLIAVRESELKYLFVREKNKSPIPIIERHMRFKLPKETTVKEFYDYVEDLKEFAKQDQNGRR